MRKCLVTIGMAASQDCRNHNLKVRHYRFMQSKISGAIPSLGLWRWGGGPRKMRHHGRKRSTEAVCTGAVWTLALAGVSAFTF